MSLLVVGSVALDTVETPFGRAEDVLGGSASYFSASASLFHPVQLVGVVGDDFPLEVLDFLRTRDVDLDGLASRAGSSFRWSGYYEYDLNVAHTRETRLGVFAEFEPEIPDRFRDADWVFLANIDPELQLDVLEQTRSPRLVACDTMNFWIEGKPDALERLLRRIDIVLLNDGEVRQLTGERNLSRAARAVMDMGPDTVVVKKGEHGAMLFNSDDSVFFVPGYPLENIHDPTGAGDSFAGGFLGYLAQAGDANATNLRRAMVYGSAMGSFAVERFSVERLMSLGPAEVHRRVEAFRDMTQFEVPRGAEAEV